MSNRLIFAALLFAISLFSVAQVRPQPKVTMRQAKATALEKHQGAIKSSELEKEHGRLIYSFDIATMDGIYEVAVDAMTGQVVEDSKESAADEAKEAAEEHTQNEKMKRSRNKVKSPNRAV